MKIGIITPTYNRPDCIRSLVLQMQNQTMRPDWIAVHENGHAESYQWVIDDIATDINIAWIHTPHQICQDDWYATPLARLLENDCTHFFWCDHDDFYYRTHVETSVKKLDEGFDHVVNLHCDRLLLKKSKFEVERSFRFTAHAAGGMSSSMCFTREFALELLKDLRANCGSHYWSDNVVKLVTMPKFKCAQSTNSTTAYVAHAQACSSSAWVAET